MEIRKLIECCEFISDGDHLPPPKSVDGVPFITISNITNENKISFGDTMFVPESYYSNLNETKKAHNGDILYSVVGSFGKPVYIDFEAQMVFQRHIAILRPKSNINGRFLYYTMLNPQFYKMVDKLAIGCSQRTVTLETLRNIKVNLPDRGVQDKIVEVLSLIDNKIDRNNKINDNLEAMTYDIYMYTFFSKKPTGKLKDILVEAGKSLVQVGEAKSSNGEYPFFTSGATILKWDVPFTDGRNCFLNTGGNADVKFYVGNAAYSTDTWCVSANGNMSDYLYLLLFSIKTELDKKFFQGTGLRHLQKPLLKERPIYIPEKSELETFNKQVMPMLNIISENTRENQQLTTLRDWLLPMLMNGQATISD
ncbi:MAG: restriction endonuclease subunit S [Lachnospiraceae bacterium]